MTPEEDETHTKKALYAITVATAVVLTGAGWAYCIQFANQGAMGAIWAMLGVTAVGILSATGVSKAFEVIQYA